METAEAAMVRRQRQEFKEFQGLGEEASSAQNIFFSERETEEKNGKAS